GQAVTTFAGGGQQPLSATGEVKITLPDGIPVGPGLSVTAFKFGIASEPELTIVAGVEAHAGLVLVGTGTLGLKTRSKAVRFDGNLTLANLLPLGGATIDADPEGLDLHGTTGYDFGPASFHPDVG